MTETGTQASSRQSKTFAAAYREETEEIDPENVTGVTLRHHTVDITYRTRWGVKTVRCKQAMESASYNDVPDGFYSFYDDGTKYAYNPTERRLITVTNGDQHPVAEREDFVRFERVSYPTRAVVKGAIETDVEATIYYRSPRSDAMQLVTIEVSWMEGEAAEISGTEVGSHRRIEALTRWERDIVSKHGTTEYPLGKVTRVEFPRGHRFVVDVEGLSERKAGEQGETRLAKRARRAFRTSDSVEVSHESALEWDDL